MRQHMRSQQRSYPDGQPRRDYRCRKTNSTDTACARNMDARVAEGGRAALDAPDTAQAATADAGTGATRVRPARAAQAVSAQAVSAQAVSAQAVSAQAVSAQPVGGLRGHHLGLRIARR